MAKASKARSSSVFTLLRRAVLAALAAFVVLSVFTVLLFRWLPVPVSSVMVEREAQALFNGHSLAYRYHWVGYSDIAPSLKLAVIASEDQRFPFHHGFDERQIQIAFANWRAGDALRGASTLSQQTAKNLWLWSESDIIRKGVEAWYTLLIEGFWPKHRILEVYLNLAEWGPGIYGIEAASQHYFHVSADALTTQQSARLASILPAPRQWSPVHPNARVARHTQWVEQQMRQLGGTAYLRRLD